MTQLFTKSDTPLKSCKTLVHMGLGGDGLCDFDKSYPPIRNMGVDEVPSWTQGTASYGLRLTASGLPWLLPLSMMGQADFYSFGIGFPSSLFKMFQSF